MLPVFTFWILDYIWTTVWGTNIVGTPWKVCRTAQRRHGQALLIVKGLQRQHNELALEVSSTSYSLSIVQWAETYSDTIHTKVSEWRASWTLNMRLTVEQQWNDKLHIFWIVRHNVDQWLSRAVCDAQEK